MARYFCVTSFEEANIVRGRNISQKNSLPGLNTKNTAYTKYKRSIVAVL